ncbi:uncharacterized protein LOC105661896 isoform X3 [Megachile rotundata]|uniref:uncharacterized protein LOC105661896 isoform X3 n=1 Tax=Megachile rotundata TaxID=143995 RepID=UPI003FD396BF
MSNTRVQMVVYKLRGLTDCPAAVLRNEHAVKRPPDRFLDKQGIRNVRKQRETRNTKREILNTPSCSKRPPATALYLTYSLQKILCKMNEKERKLL